MPAPPDLLTDPYLLGGAAGELRVAWVTAWPGEAHDVVVEGTRIPARTRELSRTREDARSRVPGGAPEGVVRRRLWRHEAVVRGLEPGVRVWYHVESLSAKGAEPSRSGPWTLTAPPRPGAPVRLLLTSDHQLKPMAAANVQAAHRALGPLDGVLLAGDLVNVPDRASEWFDDTSGAAFFATVQGRAAHQHAGTRWTGAPLAQETPLFVALGNHEFMGRVGAGSLDDEFAAPVPTGVAEAAYDRGAALGDLSRDRDAWVRDHACNATTALELFPPPGDGDPRGWWAATIGDVRVVALVAATIWRPPHTDPALGPSRWVEGADVLDDPLAQGWGQHPLADLTPGSDQLTWLRRELASAAFRDAAIRLVMIHHPLHSLGENALPAYVTPRRIEDRAPDGRVRGIRYEYPLADDHLRRHVEPLLEQAGVDVVLSGHTHVFNRFVSPGGVHHLETGNVGNTYGAFVPGGRARPGPGPPWPREDLPATGDPGGLEPVVPTVRPQTGPDGRPLPYLASDEITVFTLLDTAAGEIVTHAYDTTRPDDEPWVLDRFAPRRRRPTG